jgi:DNA-binding winged helix-turn-helix (wHTH) protein
MSKFQVGDDLVIDLDQRWVLKNDIELNLSELSYRLLLTLVDNFPHIVSHEDLMAAVWQDRVVSDENLKKRVSRLREALGDTSDNPKYFVVERGMGYRCIAAVNPFIAAEPEKQINNRVTQQYATVTTQTSSQINFQADKTAKPNKALWNFTTLRAVIFISCAVLFFGYFSDDFFSSSPKNQAVVALLPMNMPFRQLNTTFDLKVQIIIKR